MKALRPNDAGQAHYTKSKPGNFQIAALKLWPLGRRRSGGTYLKGPIDVQATFPHCYCARIGSHSFWPPAPSTRTSICRYPGGEQGWVLFGRPERTLRVQIEPPPGSWTRAVAPEGARFCLREAL